MAVLARPRQFVDHALGKNVSPGPSITVASVTANMKSSHTLCVNPFLAVQERHNFREVVVIAGFGCHNFPEVVPTGFQSRRTRAARTWRNALVRRRSPRQDGGAPRPANQPSTVRRPVPASTVSRALAYGSSWQCV